MKIKCACELDIDRRLHVVCIVWQLVFFILLCNARFITLTTTTETATTTKMAIA